MAQHPPRDISTRRGDVELAAEQFGEGNAPPVVLLHGAGNSAAAWPPELCALLTRDRPVIRCDFRDAGRSSTWPVGEPGYNLYDLACDVGSVLDAAGHPAAHVVGVSLGGSVAQLLGLEHPARVRSLTIIAGTPGGPGAETDELPGMNAEMVSALYADLVEPDWSDRAAVIDYLTEAERPFQGPSFDEDFQRALSEKAFDRARDIRANVTNHFLIDMGPPWRPRLREIRVPTLIIHGDQDRIFPAEHAHALQAEIPGAKLHVVGEMGHGFPPPAYWDDLLPMMRDHWAAADGAETAGL